ncbi:MULTISPECIES: MFS transporter [Pantoea]|jgi:MFS family permease|uniref:MFS transporter n=1 Tax=Pantoea eucrina TaxID=472693 RepID=A0ABS1Z2G5_9GAMM|nr:MULTISPECIES: MFS transporter [Pantoea]AIX50842.1 major facilitator transporter [Pantoea sp. PSNIH1]MBM0746462.1 MFS transporter [Pantoea eucrina]MDJ0024123.1 MFS transporter [Pantoea eucrina]OIX93863.1 MFS transporter [Pantoea sp. Ae16]UBB14339.1 MFS transporter [Pantoea eucrina]
MARRNPYAQREWLPHEKPMLPGSPSTPLHSPGKRVAFGLIGLLITLTGALSNALVTANLTNLQGTFAAYSNEIAWLPAVYVMGNISINLLLVKFRQQFGLRLFTEAFLVLYVIVAFFHLFANDLSSAIIVRTAHGMVAAALSSLGIYYQVQAWPAKHRLKALVIGITASQLAIPLARLFSTELLQLEEWRGLYLFELGLALIALGCVLVVRLPPGDRIKAFEKLDFVTFLLLAPGMALLCGVLSLGRIEWWFTTPWLGVCLVLALVLIVSAVVVEHNRTNPLINTRWLSSGMIVRLGIAMIMIRIVLAEQNTGAIGFLQQLGLLNDQLHGLALAIIAGVICGIIASALTIKPGQLNWPIVTSLAIMIVASLMDAQSNPLTRAHNLYFSQFLLGFSSAFFLAPAMLLGIGSVVTQPKNLVSFVVLFGMSQNLGGLIGSAILGTFQTWREKYHSSLLADKLSQLDPNVTERLDQYSALFRSQLTDSVLLGAQSSSQLQTVATLQANVLAYNDTYLLTAALAMCTLLWVLWRLSRQRYLAWRQAKNHQDEPRQTAPSAN